MPNVSGNPIQNTKAFREGGDGTPEPLGSVITDPVPARNSEETLKHPVRTWKWYGDAGHLCVARWCQFHLCTLVGSYLVSTVGKYWPERSTREIHAKVHDPAWLSRNKHRLGDDFDAVYMERFGYVTIGCDRTFETMVFKAGAPCTREGCSCGLPTIETSELDFAGYNDAGAATRGHMAMCMKWANGKPKRSR